MKDVKLNLLAFAILMVVLAPALLGIFVDKDFFKLYLYLIGSVAVLSLYDFLKGNK